MIGSQTLSRLLLTCPEAVTSVFLGNSSESGRGLYAKRALKPGHVFIRETPLAFARRVQFEDSSLAPSLNQLDEALRQEGTNSARLALRIAGRVIREVKELNKSPTWDMVRHLCRAELPPHLHQLEALQMLHDTMEGASVVMTPALWSQLLGVVHMNTFGFDDGVAIFAAGSMINHSCDPNSGAGAEGVFTTVTDVDAGKELTVAYVDVRMSRSERQAWLAWNFGFHCKCSRCIAEKD